MEECTCPPKRRWWRNKHTCKRCGKVWVIEWTRHVEFDYDHTEVYFYWKWVPQPDADQK